MISKYIPGYITRILYFSLALHFFNLSIDSKDKHHESIPEDLSFNDIESLAEFFAEVIFHQHNAFEEHDERDHEIGGLTHTFTYYYSSTFTTLNDFFPDVLYTQQFKTVTYGKALPSAGKISSPPPKG
jgi:hypothetical protein